jgi:hypothetical protein
VARLRFLDVQVIAADYEEVTLTLSPLSFALVLSLLQAPEIVFYWSELTDAQKQEARDAIANAIWEVQQATT